MWRVITSNENSELQSILDEDESRALLRSADGRGPLFWAYEANNEAAIEMLKKAGASEEFQDADGKTCTNFEHGQMTEYMVCAHSHPPFGHEACCVSVSCLLSSWCRSPCV